MSAAVAVAPDEGRERKQTARKAIKAALQQMTPEAMQAESECVLV